jgi:hypothetical protein
MATTSTELAPDTGITLQKRVLSTPEVLAQSVAASIEIQLSNSGPATKAE